MQVVLEHGSWWGDLATVSDRDQKSFMRHIISQSTRKSSAESVAHMYTTLGILQQLVFGCLDQDMAEVGTWKKSPCVRDDGLPADTSKWTVTNGQLSAVFTAMFFCSKTLGKSL